MEQGYFAETYECRCISEALSRVGDKWSIMVVMELAEHAKRFSEVRRAIAGISHKMLAATLRGLECDGFVSRTVHPTKPPSVEYALTDLGEELLEPVKALGTWVINNVQRIEGARERFDASKSGR